MNAAFLLVTTAWLAGADPIPAAPVAAPAMVAAPGAGCSSCGASTCGSCGTGADREGLLSKLRARFHRDSCDSCAPACAPAPVCAPKCAPAPVCNTCNSCDEGPGFFAKLKAKFAREDCGCKGSCGSSCDSCGGEGPGLFDRLKARFQRGSSCDGCGAPACGGCSGCGAAAPIGGAIAAPPAGGHGEPLKMPKEGDAPKKLPDGKGKDGKETSAPKNIDLTPTSGKSTEVENRRPF